MIELINTYFMEIQKQYKIGDTTEYSYRTQFQNFIQSINPQYSLLHESRRDKQFGAPDFKAFSGNLNVGYIETKDLDVNLDEEIEKKQMKTYMESINNLILTNYCRFILLRNGQPELDISLFSIPNLDRTYYRVSGDKIKEFNEMIESFFGFKRLPIKNSELLATELSKKAILIKDIGRIHLEGDLEKERENPLQHLYMISTLISTN